VKVATIQFCPVYKDIKGNLRKLAVLATQAAKEGAKLIVLPELATTGYSMMSAAEAADLCEVLTEWKPGSAYELSSMAVFSAISAKYGVHVVWGVAEKDYGSGRLYNSQVLICPDGSFESYRKVNPFGNDYLWASEGRSNPPVRTISVDGETYKVGLLICRDVRDKKDETWKSFYEKGDADIVCLSANWGNGGFPATAWMEFVHDNEMTLVVSNRYGKEVPNDFGEGGICIVYSDGKVQCEGLVWSQDCIVYGEV
jgi:predicted amidohydrolase